jgi:hypothetical protein
MLEYYLLPSLVKAKKFTVIRFDTQGRMPLKKIHFGQAGYEDFTTHKNPVRKQRYLDRHQHENWNDLNTAGAWARWILWNKPTIEESVKDMEKRFDIKIIPLENV